MGHWGWGWLLASTTADTNGTRFRNRGCHCLHLRIPAGTLSLRSSPSRKDQTEGPHNLESVVSSAPEGFGGVQLVFDCLLRILIQATLSVHLKRCSSSCSSLLALRFKIPPGPSLDSAL